MVSEWRAQVMEERAAEGKERERAAAAKTQDSPAPLPLTATPSGGIETADGCWHRSPAGALAVLVGLCGCGRSDEIADVLVTVLRACATNEWPRPIPNDLSHELVLHVLDNAGLLEHGTVITGSWLTDLGKEWLAALDMPYPEADDD